MANIKVSQATIDKIKAMGMTAALKKAGGASPEMREGLKRMYGAKRVSAAGGSSSKPVTKSADAARSSASKGSVYKSADAARSAMPGKGPAARISTAKPKANTTSNPFTALHNVASPYGNKSQKWVNPLDAVQRKIGTPSPADIAAAKVKKPVTKEQKIAKVSAINAKRAGISVAEYNNRLAKAKKSK